MLGTLAGLSEFTKNAVFFDFLLIGLLYALYWFIKEKVYYIPKIDGVWKMTLVYEQSSYNPYLGMEVYYTLNIHQDATSINIESEKYAEKLLTQEIKYYDSREKTLGSYYGNIQRGFKNHPIALNIKEEGLNRNIVGRFNLKVISYCQMEGTFEKGDASSSGKVVCTKVV